MMGQNVLIQILASGISSLITFLTISITARLFGPEVLGVLAYLLGLTGLIFAFSDLGLSRAHVYFTAALKKPSKTLGTFLRLRLSLLIASAILATIMAFIKSAEYKGLFSLILFYVLSTRIAESILITFEALQLSLPQNLIRLISKLIKLVAVLVIGLKISITSLGYSWTFAIESLSLLCLSFWLLTSNNFGLKKINFFPLKFDKSLANKYLAYSLPFFFIIPLSYFQDNGIIVILEKLGSTTQVGFYSAVSGLAGFIKSLFGAVMVFFFPRISLLFSTRDFKSIQRYTDLVVKYLLILFTPLLLGLFFMRFEVINLILGTQFNPAVPVFSLFLLGMFLLMLTAPYGYVLYATKNHRPLIFVNVISLILAILASIILVPTLGAVGSVLASIIAWSFSGFFFLRLIKKHLKLTVLPKLFEFMVPAIFILLSTSWIINYYQPGPLLKLSFTLISLTLYLGALFLLKLATIKDFQYLINLVKIKKV